MFPSRWECLVSPDNATDFPEDKPLPKLKKILSSDPSFCQKAPNSRLAVSETSTELQRTINRRLPYLCNRGLIVVQHALLGPSEVAEIAWEYSDVLEVVNG